MNWKDAVGSGRGIIRVHLPGNTEEYRDNPQDSHCQGVSGIRIRSATASRRLLVSAQILHDSCPVSLYVQPLDGFRLKFWRTARTNN